MVDTALRRRNEVVAAAESLFVEGWELRIADLGLRIFEQRVRSTLLTARTRVLSSAVPMRAAGDCRVAGSLGPVLVPSGRI